MSRVLVFSCCHAPFTKKGYFKFLKDIYKQWSCNTVVCLGDLIDWHSLGFWDKEPDSFGSITEYDKAIDQLQELYSYFPKAYLTTSNHDARPYRVAAKAGITDNFMVRYDEILQCPKKWKVADYHVIDGVIYKHGESYSGVKAHENAATDHMQSAVIGHLHSQLKVSYIASGINCIFGMVVGSGIDDKQYAFRYNKKYRRRPIVGCGVVIDGKYAYTEPMDLGKKVYLK